MKAFLGGFLPFALLFFLITFTKASAQVIECPGALPAADLAKEQTVKVAERLLGRFTVALNLHGLDAINEQAILADHQDYPEQLLIKLTYLTLQCQMALLDKAMTASQRKLAVRGAFLNYVFAPTDPSATSLAAYIDDVASNGLTYDTKRTQTKIGTIEEALASSGRQDWAERWFLDPPPQADGNAPRLRSVIIASPRFESDGWQTLRRYQENYPEIHFELDGPYDLESPHFAIVAGRSLGQGAANQLLEQVKARGLPADSYIWRPPPADGGS